MEDTIKKATQMHDLSGCDYKNGALPSCAPLSVAFVPVQSSNPPRYSNNDALTRGTLFPGLDLPFMNITNKSNPYAGTPLGELMALGFAVFELSLYLDTHPNDKEAFETFQTLANLYTSGQKTYTSLYGPINHLSVANSKSYTWLNDPWPWEYTEGMGKQ